MPSYDWTKSDRIFDSRFWTVAHRGSAPFELKQRPELKQWPIIYKRMESVSIVYLVVSIK